MRFVLAGLLVVCFAGCSIIKKEPYRETCYFDLGTAPAEAACEGVGVTVASVRGQDPYHERMVFRKTDNMLEMDEYSRWSTSPARLLNRRLTLAFSQKAASTGVSWQIDAEILQFEGDLTKNTAVLAVDVSLSKVSAKGGAPEVLPGKVYRVSVPVGDRMTGDAFAKAMGVAVDQFMAQVGKDISASSQTK